MKYTNKDSSTIRSLFNTIAPTYDRANWYMSSGLHVLWNRRLISELIQRLSHVSSEKIRFLDLCCGTGEIALRYAQTAQKKNILNTIEITGIDFSEGMLSTANQRKKRVIPIDSSISCSFIQANATALPLKNKSYDQVAIAYGIRNIDNRAALFSEITRVLVPGGTVAILELTSPNSPIIQKIHSWYLQNIIPKIGRIISKNQLSYEYLSRSIQDFISPKTLILEMEQFGIQDIKTYPMAFGTATLLIGRT